MPRWMPKPGDVEGIPGSHPTASAEWGQRQTRTSVRCAPSVLMIGRSVSSSSSYDPTTIGVSCHGIAAFNEVDDVGILVCGRSKGVEMTGWSPSNS